MYSSPLEKILWILARAMINIIIIFFFFSCIYYDLDQRYHWTTLEQKCGSRYKVIKNYWYFFLHQESWTKVWLTLWGRRRPRHRSGGACCRRGTGGSPCSTPRRRLPCTWIKKVSWNITPAEIVSWSLAKWLFGQW